jgi:hypothetical protein
MKKTLVIMASFAIAISLALVACTSTEANTAENVVISHDSLVKRGSYLVNAMGCDDCHSPKIFGPKGMEIDMERRFGGHQATVPTGKADKSVFKEGWMLFTLGLTSYVGPWGQSYSANISSDGTGIGNWTEEQFFRAIREGKSKGLAEGRELLPPMPWFVYKNLSDVDLKSIFSYLKTTKPVRNVVPGPKSPKDI